MLASDLLGYGIHNENGDMIGEIEDLVIDLANGQVNFLTMSYGGFLDIGDQTFPLPLRALRYDAEDESLILNVDESNLENAPSTDDSWLDLSQPGYDVAVRNFWRNIDPELTQRQANRRGVRSTRGSLIKASRFIGKNVQNIGGEGLGAVDNLIIDLGNGRVSYAVLPFGSILDVGDKFIPMPLNQFDLDTRGFYESASEARLLINREPEQLERMIGFDPEEYINTRTPGWDSAIRDFWSTNTERVITGTNTIISETVGIASDTTETIPETITAGAEQVVTGTNEIISDTVDAVGDTTEAISETVTTEASEAISATNEGITDTVDAVSDTFGEMTESISETVTSTLDSEATSGTTTDDTAVDTEGEVIIVVDVEPQIMRSSELLGLTVENFIGDNIGDV